MRKKNKCLILLFCFLIGIILFFTIIYLHNHATKILKIRKEVLNDFNISEVRELVTREPCFSPAWSPDGEKIVCSSVEDKGIFIMDKDGTNKKVLTNDIASGYKYAWSLDGKNIAYRGVIFEGNIRTNFIGIIDVENGRTETILMPTHTNIQPPIWSYGKDKKRVKYIINGQTNYSKAYPFSYKDIIDKNSLENINRSLYYAEQGLYMVENDDIKEKLIKEGFDPVFSPDKLSFVYSRWSNLHLFSFKDGSDKFLAQGYHPSWSPDGKNIVYHQSIDNGEIITGSDLYIIDVINLKKNKLFDSPNIYEINPSWSPSGKEIVFNDLKSGKVYMVQFK